MVRGFSQHAQKITEELKAMALWFDEGIQLSTNGRFSQFECTDAYRDVSRSEMLNEKNAHRKHRTAQMF